MRAVTPNLVRRHARSTRLLPDCEQLVPIERIQAYEPWRGTVSSTFDETAWIVLSSNLIDLETVPLVAEPVLAALLAAND